MATSSIYGDSTGQNNTSLYEKYLKGDMTVVDPYTRSLLEAGLSKGQAFDILTPEGYEAQRQARASQLQSAVVAPLAAQEETDARRIQGFYEKTGKLASSASTADLMRNSEQYRANIASELAKGNLSIYEQLDTRREAELGRIYGSGIARQQTEAGLYGTSLGSSTQLQIAGLESNVAYAGMGSQEKIAFAQMGTQEKIATLQSNTQKEIARIEADTTLTVADKQAAVSALNNDTQKVIANINASTQITTTGMQTTSAERITEKQLAASLAELNITVGADKEKYLAQIKAAKEQGTLDDKRIRELTVLQIEADFKKTGMTITADKEKWSAEIEWAREKGLMDDKTVRDMTAKQITADLEKTGLNIKANRDQYMEEIKWAKEKGYLDAETAKSISANQIAADLKKTGLTLDANRDQYMEELKWAKEKGLMDDKTARDIVTAQIKGDLEKTGLVTKADAERSKNELAWAKEKGYLDAQTSKDIVSAQIQASYKEADLTSGRSLQAVRDQLQNAKDMQLIDNQAKADLQSDYLLEQARQFNVKQGDDMALAWAAHGEGVRQFGLTNAQNYEIALKTLKLNQQTITDNTMTNRVTALINILGDPMVSTFFGANEQDGGMTEEFGDIIYDILATDEYATDDEMDSGDMGTVLTNISNKVSSKVAEIQAKAKKAGGTNG